MKLQDIRDLLIFVKKYYSSDIDVIDVEKLSKQQTKANQFYRILTESKIISDEEAAYIIYENSHSEQQYQRLKSNFLISSLNTIPFFNLARKDISDFTRAVFKTQKDLLNVSVLLRLGSRNSGITLAKKTLVIAEEYELHTTAIDLLEYLRMDSGLRGNRIEQEKYQLRLEKKISLLESETRIKSSEQRLLIHFAKKTYLDEAYIKPAHEALIQIESALKENDSYANRLVQYRLQYIYHQLRGYPLESAAACDNALGYLKTKPQMAGPLRFAEFDLYKFENYVLARDFEKGIVSAVQCKLQTEPGDTTWFQVQEYYFLLLIQTQKFHEAKAVLDEVIQNERFGSQLTHLRERWKIFGLYVDYVIISQSKVSHSHLLRQNRYKNIVREFPTYSKDKQGFNVGILILNILLLLETDKKDLLIEQFDALTTYQSIHLQKKYCAESYLLFKLIRLMVVNEFDLSVIEKKSPSLEKQLAEAMPTIGEITNGVQVLPPEWVWARMKVLLIHWLPKKKKRRKTKPGFVEIKRLRRSTKKPAMP